MNRKTAKARNRAAERPLVPAVTRTRSIPSATVLDFVQATADAAYSSRTANDPQQLATAVDPICAIRGPVPRHTDDMQGVAAGMRIYGLVLRSDGHVLHSERLPPAGIELRAGDLYCIDPFDPHWTTAPSEAAELIFAVAICPPERRTPHKLAHDFLWTVIVASINAQRAEQGKPAWPPAGQ